MYCLQLLGPWSHPTFIVMHFVEEIVFCCNTTTTWGALTFTLQTQRVTCVLCVMLSFSLAGDKSLAPWGDLTMTFFLHNLLTEPKFNSPHYNINPLPVWCTKLIAGAQWKPALEESRLIGCSWLEMDPARWLLDDIHISWFVSTSENLQYMASPMLLCATYDYYTTVITISLSINIDFYPYFSPLLRHVPNKSQPHSLPLSKVQGLSEKEKDRVPLSSCCLKRPNFKSTTQSY